MGKMSEIDAEAREVLDICERLVSEKAKRGISQEEAERLERLWRDESFMGRKSLPRPAWAIFEQSGSA